MIDISSERVVTLTQATRHVPARRKGKKPAVSTLYRWALNGVRGIHLETLMVGGTRCTSIEGLQRFFDELTEAADRSAPTGPPVNTLRRQAEIKAAERQLDAAGI